MNVTFEVLRVVQLAVFGALALLTLARWIRRPGPAEARLAVIFSILGGIVAIGFLIPQESSNSLPDQLMRKSLLAVLLLFPYMLYRFAAVMRAPVWWATSTANLLTVAVCLLPFALGDLPQQGAPRSSAWPAYIGLLLVQWLFTSIAAGAILWRRGRGQPTVVRRRMRFLSLGTFGLALGIIVSVAFGGDGDITISRIASQGIGVFSAFLFFLGATPPAAMVLLWRRPEAAVMRAAVNDLMRAETAEDVAAGLLEPSLRVIGGRASVLIVEGRVVGSVGVGDGKDEISFEEMEAREAAADGSVLRFQMSKGALLVALSPYAPFFGTEECEMLDSTAVLADLALERVATLARERDSANAQRDFLAVVSHDLRTPLAVIQGYTSLMTENWGNLSDDERMEFNATIDRQSRHLARLVNDLLMSSRLDAAALHPQPEDIPLRAAVDDALESIGDNAADVRVSVDAFEVVRIDPEHLQRLLVNLLNNAFVHGQAPVDLSAVRRGSLIEIRVRDHGAGVAPSEVASLFDRFTRATSRERRARGTGLGLYIVHGLATSAGGDVRYEEPMDGPGACFRVRLPAAMPTEVAPERRRAAG